MREPTDGEIIVDLIDRFVLLSVEYERDPQATTSAAMLNVRNTLARTIDGALDEKANRRPSQDD